MEKMWKQLLLAAVLGILIPQVIMAAGEWALPVRDEPAEPTEWVETQVPETVVVEKTVAVMYIPVVMEDGSVQIMELEAYVRGVVLAEMPASFEQEALKAQAIAARTYVLRRLSLRDKHTQGVICADYQCCQAYITEAAYLEKRGTQADMDKVSEAVADTAGLVLTYNGRLIESTYFACSGGRTEDALAVWGEDIPYLQSVDSLGEVKGEAYDETVCFTASEFARCLGRQLRGSPESWFGEVTHTAGGGVDTMTIGGTVYTGVQLRELLDLNSTLFTVRADAEGITVETKGWGHRVGMSQYGADAMALGGSTYREILSYYYPGTEIDKLSDVK